jgi:hypothetical protein
MQNSFEKLDLNPTRMQGAPPLAPDAPQRQAHDFSVAMPETTSGVPQREAAGYAAPNWRSSGLASNRNSYFSLLLRVLHRSRRRNAASVIRRYRHLLQDGDAAGRSDQSAIASDKLDMANGEGKLNVV